MVSVQRESNALTKYLQKAPLSERSQQPYLPYKQRAFRKITVLQPPSNSSPVCDVSLLFMGPAFPARVPTSLWSSISGSIHPVRLPGAISMFCLTDITFSPTPSAGRNPLPQPPDPLNGAVKAWVRLTPDGLGQGYTKKNPLQHI